MYGKIAAVMILLGTHDFAEAAEASRERFGVLNDGTGVEAVVLKNERGVEARVIAYGARLQSLRVPDSEGRADDVVLGYDDIAGYEADQQHHGATVGRFANRIARGVFVLDGRRFTLEKNSGDHHLHGGTHGFDTRLWTVESVSSGAEARVVLSHVSPDGEGGYPGTLKIQAIYALNDAGELSVEYRATTDRPTIVNITHHSYFNLAGAGGTQSALDQVLTLDAARFTPSDAGSIPTGAIAGVAGTPMDFRKPEVIGARVRDTAFEQLRQGRGYDHKFVVDGAPGTLRRAARLADKVSGRIMDVSVTAPGMQVYSGNFLDGSVPGKGGKAWRQGDGVCLEPQHFPDAPNKPGFPSARLDPGATYVNRMVFRFSTDGPAGQGANR